MLPTAASSGLRSVRRAVFSANALSRPASSRTFLSWLRKRQNTPADPPPLLLQDDLFHPFTKSPFPAIQQRGKEIGKLANCPTCVSEKKETPTKVRFECPDCGWPTHCTEQHWLADVEHAKYCSRLREVNEDEHDLRTGRKMREFDLPGPQDNDETLSFSNWDIFWYTRGFPSMDTERMRRNASKLLTYPMTIGAVLHQHSGLTVNNQRVTPEGIRSLAALRSTLHVAPGAPESEDARIDKPPMRIFILGARAESSLPPNVWEQLSLLFPSTVFNLFFIGPQVSLPKDPEPKKPTPSATPGSPSPQPTASHAQASPETQEPNPVTSKYLPNVYEPPTPDPIVPLKRTRSSLEVYGIPSYTSPYNPQLTVTGIQGNYMDVHPQFQDTYDPYTDVFFFFSPGFGFPSATAPRVPGEPPVLQIASEAEWGGVLPTLLATKCAIFVTGFSPADVERDVRSLSTAPGVAGEFDWVVTPGANAFGSEKWEVADFDPRVMVKTNWGIWGIRGKRRDIREAVLP